MPSPIAKRSGDASLLISYFADKPPGHACSWEQLERMIGRERRVLQGLLSSTVRKALEREHHKTLLTISGQGVRVASPVEIVGQVAPQQRRRAHSAARRARRALSTVVVEKLPDEHRTAFFREMSLVGVIELATTERAAKKVEQYAKADGDHLAIARTLEALK